MESERLLFRALNLNDAERLFEIYSDKIAMQYRQSNHHETIDDTYKMLERDREVKKSNYEIRYGIVLKEKNQLIGSVMYQPIYKKAIIGYSIAKECWGNGYATEVVNFIIKQLQNNQFNTIEAWVLKENIASMKVLEKNNFSKISQTIYPNSNYYLLKL